MDSMVGTVARVVGSPVHEESVQQRLSAEGTYISVTIGPVLVQNSDQVGVLLLLQQLIAHLTPSSHISGNR